MKHIPDILLITGAGMLSYGAWMVYQPSGFIVGGILVLIAGIKTAK